MGGRELVPSLTEARRTNLRRDAASGLPGPTRADTAWLSIHTIPTSFRGSYRHSEFQSRSPI